MRRKFLAAYRMVMCMNKSHLPLCYPICMGMPLEQISAMPVLSNVGYYRKKKDMFHFSLQPEVHLQHLGKTCTGRTIVLRKIIIWQRKKILKMKILCLCLKKSISRNNTELKLIPSINVWHTINLKRIISHTVIRLLHGQDHRRVYFCPSFILSLF